MGFILFCHSSSLNFIWYRQLGALWRNNLIIQPNQLSISRGRTTKRDVKRNNYCSNKSALYRAHWVWWRKRRNKQFKALDGFFKAKIILIHLPNSTKVKPKRCVNDNSLLTLWVCQNKVNELPLIPGDNTRKESQFTFDSEEYSKESRGVSIFMRVVATNLLCESGSTELEGYIWIQKPPLTNIRYGL